MKEFLELACFILNRNDNPYCGAFSGNAVYMNRPVVQLDQLLCNCQAEPCTCARFVRVRTAVVTVEKLVENFCFHSFAIIFN